MTETISLAAATVQIAPKVRDRAEHVLIADALRAAAILSVVL